MSRKFETKSDDKTHRFMPVKPGFGKNPNNSKLDKFKRFLSRHPATASRKRKKHGRP